MSEQDGRDELARAIYPLAFDSPIEDRVTKILRGDAYRIADSVLAAGYRKQPEPEWEYGTALVGASGEIWDEEPSESLEAALEVVAGSNSESTQYPDESPCVVVRRSKWERVEEERG